MSTWSRKKYVIAIVVIWAPAFAAAWNIDMWKVEQVWLDRNNELRTSLELPEYTIDTRLSETAQMWSQKALVDQTIDHKRSANDGYYNYGGIEKWFASHWVRFKNINRATFSESLGYGYFSCKKEDCTDDLIAALKTTWTFYMKEKPYMGMHYKALVHPYFQTMGLGVSVDPTLKRYYVTLHYAAQVIPQPMISKR